MADVPASIKTTARFEGEADGGAWAYSGEFDRRGDVDWIRIDVVAGVTYQLATDVDTPSYQGYPDIVVRNANGNVVNSTDENIIVTRFTATATGTYFIQVSLDDLTYEGASYDLFVTSGSRTLEGAGTATYTGSAGSLIYDVGRYNNDIIVGAGGRAFGGDGSDEIQTNAAGGAANGGADDDTLSGAAGGDLFFGGSGDDVVYGENGDDTLYGGGGNDLVNCWTGNDSGFGGAGSDQLWGATGNQTLDGGTGADVMMGGIGSDTYYVDDARDVVMEDAGEGFDTVFASASYRLEAGVEIDWMRADPRAGKSALSLTGNEFDQLMEGNDGANTLTGAGGDDRLAGHGGADHLAGGAGLDIADYFSAASRVVVNLAQPGQNFGDAAGDTYSSIEVVNGSLFRDALTGDAAANILIGFAGNDTLNGGLGRDTLTSGSGSDTFVFDTAPAPGNVDFLRGFDSAEDSFRLENSVFLGIGAGPRLASAAFKNLAQGAVDADDRIIFNSATGDLFWDRDGSGGAYGRVKFAELDLDFLTGTVSHQDFFIV